MFLFIKTFYTIFTYFILVSYSNEEEDEER